MKKTTVMLRYFMKRSMITFLAYFCLTASLIIISSGQSYAAVRYVDSSIATSDNGQSWATAWKTFADITGLSAGDVVYISGGPTGSSQTYSISTITVTAGSSASSRITYQIGQDSAHNGTAIFNSSSGYVTQGNVVVSGDAGDGLKHFVFNTDARSLSTNAANIRISYVDCGNKSWGFYSNGGTNIEIDHINFVKVDGGDDFFAFLNLSGATWDVNNVHHCTVQLIRKDDTSGWGDDGIQGGSNGLSVYNNSFISYVGTYTAGQHQDAWQQTLGNYIKIYNNYFKNIANYPVFADAYYGDFAHLWIYNNVAVITSSALRDSISPSALVVGPDGGSYNQMGRWPVFDDVIIANNTVVNYGEAWCVALQNNYGQSATFTNCVVSNNICLDAIWGLGLAPSVTSADNVVTSDGAGHFVSYTALSESNNFHLLSSDTLFKDQGTTLSSYFTTDYDGYTRSGTWDIGAYEYVSGGSDTTPPASPTGLSVE